MTQQLGKWMVCIGLVMAVVAGWMKTALPEPKLLQAGVLNEPVQNAVSRPPMAISVGGIDYSVQPLYTYDLYGMVVSKHDANAWWDYLHREWNDKLNVVDLCVVWGQNARTGGYRGIQFSSGQFTCNYETSSDEVWQGFDVNAISNNHLLTNNPTLARQMREVRVGDQIHFRGYLAEYSHHHGFDFKRGTSTVRTDSGNGACETVYVEAFEVLRRGGGPWHTLQWVGAGLLVLGVLGWFTLPRRVDRG